MLKLFLAKKVFDVVKKSFDRCGEADETAAEVFLDAIGCNGLRQAKKYESATLVVKPIQREAKKQLRDKGPAYLVNLMLETSEKATEYAGEASKKHGWKRQTQPVFKKVSETCLKLNNQYYEALTCVIEAFSNLLNEDYKIISDTQRFHNNFGETFSWCPVSFPEEINATGKTGLWPYITNLFDARSISQHANNFKDTIEKNLIPLSDIHFVEGRTSQFDASSVISKFVREEFDNDINGAIEDLIAKAFSGKTEAKAMKLENGQQVPSDELKTAARQIVSHLQHNAAALADVTLDAGNNGLQPFPSNVCITVPKACEHLIELIKDEAVSQGVIPSENINQVVASDAVDEITLQRIYSAVPAFRMRWVRDSDGAYFKSRADVGLHLEQTHSPIQSMESRLNSLLHNWTYLPPVYNVSTWDVKELNDKDHKQELELIAEAGADLDAATELGIGKRILHDGTTNQYDYYISNIARDAVRSQEQNIKEAENYINALTIDDINNYAAGLNGAEPTSKEYLDYCINAMRDEGIFAPELNLTRATDSFVTPGSYPDNPDFFKEYAKNILRMRMFDWAELKRTIPVVRDLKEKTDALLAQYKLNKRRNDRLNTFKELLCSGDDNDFINYNADNLEWQIRPDANDAWEKLCDLPRNNYSEEFREYYAFEAFCDLNDAKYGAIKQRLDESKDSVNNFHKINDNVDLFNASLDAIYRCGKVDTEIEVQGSITAGVRTFRHPISNAHFCDGMTPGDTPEDTSTKQKIRKTYAFFDGIILK